MRQMRSEYSEKGKTGRKQTGSVKLSVPSLPWGAYLARTVHFDRDEAGKVSYSRSLGRLAILRNYFCGSANVRTRSGSMTISTTGDTIRLFAPGRGRRVPTFFHGSTDVRTSLLSGCFSEHPTTQHAGLCFRLSSAMSSAWRLASFRRACRADQAVAHAIELDLDERLLDESSIGHLVGLPSL